MILIAQATSLLLLCICSVIHLLNLSIFDICLLFLFDILCYYLTIITEQGIILIVWFLTNELGFRYSLSLDGDPRDQSDRQHRDTR